MSRTQKLYQRLDQIEVEYLALLRMEREAVLRGNMSHYLGDKRDEIWHILFNSHPDDRALELQRLEKEVRNLRAKLREPVPGPAVAVAEALVKRIKDAGEWSLGANKRWVRDAIDELRGITGQEGIP